MNAKYPLLSVLFALCLSLAPVQAQPLAAGTTARVEGLAFSPSQEQLLGGPFDEAQRRWIRSVQAREKTGAGRGQAHVIRLLIHSDTFRDK